jgi:PAS domain S-box-containing protein
MGAKLQLFALRKNGTEFPVEISLSPVETAEGMLVASAIRDVSERKMAEESRLRLAAIVESSDDAIISKTRDGIIVSWNAGAQQSYGYTEAEAVGKPIAILVPLELREEENKILERLRAGERIEHYETLRITKAGRRINISLSLSPIKDSTGTTLGICGISRDITQRKLAEQALADMTRKLIEAQEQERARIGRELHDDINQRLAMLAVELEQLQDDPSEVQSRVQELRRQTTQISNDVQALSHDLHASKLEYLGVAAGMNSWCKEFGERQNLEIDCRSDVRSTLPNEIGLCLFRVLQEALHNAAKHSGVKRIKVQLHEESGEIHLNVKDLGKGFDIEAARQGRGLGLTSMQERVRLVNGTIEIQSKPMGGTTIHVRVPLEAEHGSQRAAG